MSKHRQPSPCPFCGGVMKYALSGLYDRAVWICTGFSCPILKGYMIQDMPKAKAAHEEVCKLVETGRIAMKIREVLESIGEGGTYMRMCELLKIGKLAKELKKNPPQITGGIEENEGFNMGVNACLYRLDEDGGVAE